MPIPKPHDKETHDAFMDRCMGDDVMTTEYPESAQRFAVCQSSWEGAHKGAKAAGPMIFWKDKETGMRYMAAALEIKELDAKGTFEGFASIYGNVDLGGDVVEPGAFREFVKTRDGKIRILDGHNTRAAIGKGELSEERVGLRIRGQLTLGVARAREVYELMKDGIIDGLSIGYDILPGGAELTEAGIRRLKALKLWEVSTVPFPMNPLALVEGVKATEKVTDIRELEDLLREAAGLSRSQAKLHAGAIWATKTGQREAGAEEAATVQRMIEYFSSIKRNFTKE